MIDWFYQLKLDTLINSTVYQDNNSVLVFGELLWDLLPEGRVLGGAPANLGYRIQSLGIPVTLITALGNDDLGHHAERLIKREGLDTSFFQWRDDYPTGTVDVFFRPDGGPDYKINTEVAYDYIGLNEELLEQAARCSMLCFGTLIQRAPKSRETLKSLIEAAPQAVKLLDINLRKNCFTREVIEESLRCADILKISDDELKTISELFSLDLEDPDTFSRRIIKDFDLSVVVVTLGKYGVYAHSNQDEDVYVPGHQIRVQDSIGSGDSFTAGFAYSYLKHDSLLECCELGGVLGALATTKKGGMPSINVSEIGAFSSAGFPRVIHEKLVRYRQ